MTHKLVPYLLSGGILLPFALLLGLSLAGQWSYPQILPEAWTIDHWRTLIALEGNLGSSLILSIGISLFVALVATTTGFLTSRYIAYSDQRER
ncbi:MAG: ABC transporter permease, partial [Bacteroidota bacterium]